jgi:hypothetical protein
MTVAALPAVASYIENGVTTAFPAPFRFKSSADLVVDRLFADGSTLMLAPGVDYTVAGGATDAGGVVTRTAATTGATLRVRRRTARSQAMVYATGDRFPAKSHEGALDTQMLIAQEQDAAHADLATRALQLLPGEVAPAFPPPAGRRGTLFGFDAVTGAPGLVDRRDFRGDPGGSLSDIGTFAAARLMNILAAQPGATAIRLTDRGRATWAKWTGGVLPAQDADRWWFTDAGGARWIIADRDVSIEAVGALESTLDNGPAINALLRFARDHNRTATVPIGDWRYTGTLAVDGAELRGAGYGSNLIATVKGTGGIVLSGTAPVVSGIRRTFTGEPGRGSGQPQSHAISIVPGTTGFRIVDCFLDGGTDAGILNYAGSDGLISRTTVQNMEADGIHNTNALGGGAAANNVLVERCIARDCGDDHFPVVSYVNDGGICSNITFIACQSIGGNARAFACVGGTDIQYEACVARDARYAGFLIDSDNFNGGTQANRNVKWTGGNILGCGSTTGASYGAIHVSARSGYDAVTVLIDGVTVSTSRNWGLKAAASGGAVRGLRLINSVFEDTTSDGVNAIGVTDLVIEGNVFTRNGGNAYGIFCEAGAGMLSILANRFQLVNQGGPDFRDVCNIGFSAAYTRIEFCGNHDVDRATGAQKTERFMESPNAGIICEGNTPNSGLAFGPGYDEKQRVKAAAQVNSVAAGTEAVAAPTAEEFNALVGAHNTLLADTNALLGKLRDAGLVGLS